MPYICSVASVSSRQVDGFGRFGLHAKRQFVAANAGLQFALLRPPCGMLLVERVAAAPASACCRSRSKPSEGFRLAIGSLPVPLIRTP